LGSLIELNTTRLKYPVSVRRNAPDCFTALVEASARSQFGIRRITKAWFCHSFQFKRSEAQIALKDDGRTLDVTFGRGPYGRRYLGERLRHYYGLTISVQRFDSFDSVLDAIRCALESGELIMSTFGLGRLKGWYEYGDPHAGIDHLITPTRLDLSNGTLSAMESIIGSVEVDLKDYAQCFERCRDHGVRFVLIRCHREPDHEERPVLISEVQRDLEDCVSHLRSADPDQGLAALRRAVADIGEALARLQTPAKVPGLWTFALDRYALQQSLPDWKAAGVANDSALTQLDALLGKAAAMWRGVTAVLHDAVVNQDVCGLVDLVVPLQEVVHQEQRVADLMEAIQRDLG
jgi:hypothetical protein